VKFLRKRNVFLILTAVVAASIFILPAIAGKPQKPDPLADIWEAITTLQTQLASLQSIINTRVPQTGKLSFSPVDFGVTGNTIDSTSSSHYYFAEVHLPQGATITNIAFLVNDQVASNGANMELKIGSFGDLSGDASPVMSRVAYTHSLGTTSGYYEYLSVPSFADPYWIPEYTHVDNDNSWYYLVLWMPPVSGEVCTFYGGFIEYTLPS
jgi:hypothetical protein